MPRPDSAVRLSPRAALPSHARSGLTLIELVLVLTVLVALAAMTLPNFSHLNHEALQNSTLATLRNAQETILSRYAIHIGGILQDSSSPFVVAGMPGPDPLVEPTSLRLQHPQLVYLFRTPNPNRPELIANPATMRGWLGPYLMGGHLRYPGQDPRYGDNLVYTPAARGFDRIYGEAGDMTVVDAWGNPIVIQTPDDNPQLAALGYSCALVSAGADGVLPTSATLAPGATVKDDNDNLYLPLILATP